MKNRVISLLLTAIMVVSLFHGAVFAEEALWQGNGSKDAPYIIATAEDLIALANNYTDYRGEYFIVTDNISVNDETFAFNDDTGLVLVTDGENTAYLGTGILGGENGDNTEFDETASVMGQWYALGKADEEATQDTYLPAVYGGEIIEWSPIGNMDNLFFGHFDGGDYTISGIYINPAEGTADVAGLFGYVEYSEIENIRLANSYVNGNIAVGGIIGTTDYSSIVTGCENTSVVIGNQYAGGIVGACACSITESINSGVIAGEMDSVGGIAGVGRNISYSYNKGIVNGGDKVGGIAGRVIGDIEKCYNLGNVNGLDEIGGIVGYNNGAVCQTYNMGNIIGNGDKVGAIAGSAGSEDCEDCNNYYLENSAVDAGANTATALTQAQMKETASFEGWDFEDEWVIEPKTGYAYPQFMKCLDPKYGERSALWDGIIAKGFAKGEGTKKAPYIISSVNELAYLAKSVNEGNSYSGVYFRLDTDIQINDTAAKYWKLNAIQWIPIGNESNDFQGNFDGNNHTISGIYINNTDDTLSGFGLFGYIKDASIKNLTVKDSYIKSNGNYTAAIVGRTDGSCVIENCHNDAKVAGVSYVGGIAGYATAEINRSTNSGRIIGETYVGGIAGVSYHIIEACENSGEISGLNWVGGIVGQHNGIDVSDCRNKGDVYGNSDIGGIAGGNDGYVTYSYNEGTVEGDSVAGGIAGVNTYTIEHCGNIGTVLANNHVGGIAGNNEKTILLSYNSGASAGEAKIGGIAGSNAGEIEQSYNSGSVTGESYVGGIAGVNYNLVSDIFNSGAVSGELTVGGIVGMSHSTVENAYNSGDVAGETNAGAIAGSIASEDYISNSYYLLTEGLAVDGIGLIVDNSTESAPEKVIGLTDAQMQTKDAFAGFDFKKIWVIMPDSGSKYPCFIEMLDSKYGEVSAVWDGTAAKSFESGNGTEDDPFIIKTAEQLALLAKNVNSGVTYENQYFKLAADIRLNDTSAKYWRKNASEWAPIGTEFNVFEGSFDGDGYTVSGIYIDNKRMYQGLFGRAHGATIVNLGVTDSYISGGLMVGAVVGSTVPDNDVKESYQSVIENCFVDAQILGGDLVGGIAGYNYGIIENCNSNGAVSGGHYIGGIAGVSILVSDSNNMADVTGEYHVGGIVGYATEDGVSECINLGDVTGDGNVGGIAGYNASVIENSFNSGDIYSEDHAGGIAGYNTGDIKNCHNDGYVSGGYYIGGIAGIVNYGAEITLCRNGGVTEAVGYAGGIAGMVDSANISDCYNTGNISSDYYSGGVAGYCCGEINSCYNIGIVSGSNYVGAIIGCRESGTVSNNYYLENSATMDEADPGTIGASRDEVALGGQGFDVDNETYNGDVSGEIAVLTDEEMQFENSFEGFDFVDIWTMGGKEDYLYPEFIHRCEYDDCIIAEDGSKHLHICLCGDYTEEEHENTSVTVDATCTEDGYTEYTCERCGYVTVESISAKGHIAGEWVTVKEADYESDGLQEKRCTVCNELVASKIIAKLVKDEAPTPPDEGEDYILGDVNGNGSVDMTDYILVKRAYFGTYMLTEDEMKRADVNVSGGIDMTDYILVKRIYFGTYTTEA